MVYTKHLLYGSLYTTVYLSSSTKCTLKMKNIIILFKVVIGQAKKVQDIWLASKMNWNMKKKTYSWGSYIFRTTWINHIEYSCSSFFFCNWKKGSGWKTKESHKNRSMHKSMYMIHIIAMAFFENKMNLFQVGETKNSYNTQK
jgi:hypothetical protein